MRASVLQPAKGYDPDRTDTSHYVECRVSAEGGRRFDRRTQDLREPVLQALPDQAAGNAQVRYSGYRFRRPNVPKTYRNRRRYRHSKKTKGEVSNFVFFDGDLDDVFCGFEKAF